MTPTSAGAETYSAEIDGSKCRTLRAFYPRIAKALVFPDYFGKNLDALFDALCDLSGIDQSFKDIKLTIIHADQFLSKEKSERRQAVFEIFHGASQAENRYDGKIFTVILK